MNITKETKLKELLTEYPWLKDEIVKVNDKFRNAEYTNGKDHAWEGGYCRNEQEIRDGCRYHYIQTDRADQEPLMLEEKV